MVPIGFWWLVTSVLVGIALAVDLGLSDTAGHFLLLNALPVAVVGFCAHVLLRRLLRSRRSARPGGDWD